MDLEQRDIKSGKNDLSPLILVVGLLLACVLYVFFILSAPKCSPCNPTPPAVNYLTYEQLIILGKPLQNKVAEDFLFQIKDDLKTNKEVLILEGPYWIASMIMAASFPELQADGYSFSRYYIIIDSDFYRKLNNKEIKAVIAHEMGHIHHIEQLVKMEIDADNLALKYVSPQTFIDLLDKAFINKDFQKISKEHRLRIENLEKIKKTKKQNKDKSDSGYPCFFINFSLI